MMRVSWRLGSKPAREMTRPISSSLPIFTIGLPFTAVTVTLAVTRGRFPGVDSILAAQAEPGHIGGRVGFRLIPRLFFSANSPPPHSAPNVATSPFYKDPFVVAPNAYPGPPGIIGPNAAQHVPQTLPGYGYKGGGDYFFYNFAALTPSIPAADRQSFYGSFTRDICDKYLVVFADFKYTRSFFDSALAATPFSRGSIQATKWRYLRTNGLSVPIQNPFNPFTVADATLIYNGQPVPVTTGVRFRAINDEGVRTAKFTLQDMLFDAGPSR